MLGVIADHGAETWLGAAESADHGQGGDDSWGCFSSGGGDQGYGNGMGKVIRGELAIPIANFKS